MHTIAFWLLMTVGHLGAVDVVVYHGRIHQVPWRPASRHEATIHAVRHLCYGAQFLWLPNVQLHGALAFAVLPVYALDMFVAWYDVWIEKESRAEVGGLRQGEYLLHIMLSFLVGMHFLALGQVLWGWSALPTALVWEGPPVPWPAKALCTFMGVTALGLGAWGVAPGRAKWSRA